ncbi:MAG: methionyl-tRNA formyltransferase [Clostridiales bacterium]|nr:methionyl-tRNA formyltransferase [Clostridiales bacterium]
MKILFMGTPEFAQWSLSALWDNGENIVGVVTQPDKPKGRGYVLTPPPVKVYALEKNIPVYQPRTLCDEAFADLLCQLYPDLIVVVAYGKKLPVSVLNYPKHGCINVHGSLLPKYRGAAPIQRAIMNGDTVTGITTMYMAEGIDTGDMLVKNETEILPEDDFKSLHDRLAKLGAKTLLETLSLLKGNKLLPQKQDDSLATYAKKIEKTDCIIDFSKTAKAVYDQIRALSPAPLAFTKNEKGRMIKIVRSRLSSEYSGGDPGKILALDSSGEGYITVACGSGCVDILSLIPEGKSKMTAAEFIRGRQVSIGEIWSDR